jgi:hypothetical protein
VPVTITSSVITVTGSSTIFVPVSFMPFSSSIADSFLPSTSNMNPDGTSYCLFSPLSLVTQRLPVDELGPYGALLRAYRFLFTREPGELASAIEALRQAVSREPDFGLGWSQLGRLHAVNYAFEVSSIDTPIEEAVSLAQRGVLLEPTSRRARAVLALALLHEGLARAGLHLEAGQ